MNENRLILDAFNRATQKGLPCALATIVHISGSSYRRPGAKMLVTAEGEISGSVSGGCLERDLIRRSLLAIKDGERRIVTYDTSRDTDDSEQEAMIQSAGLGCEGVIEILIEPKPQSILKSMAEVFEDKKTKSLTVTLPDGRVFSDVMHPPFPFFIFGAGHDAIAMTEMAYQMGWETTLVDCRSAFAVPKRFFTKATHVVQCEPDAISVKLPTPSAAIVMTHNYAHDKCVLKNLLESQNQLPENVGSHYFGVIGPRIRTEKLLKEIEDEGINITDARRAQIHFPAGLDLGGEGPNAIALAVASEIQAVVNGGSAGFLKDRPGPIHEKSSNRDLRPAL